VATLSPGRALRAHLLELDWPEVEALLGAMTDDQLAGLLADWQVWARDEQLEPPGEWTFWFVMAGRGFGKTRAGAEWTHEAVRTYPWFSLVGPTLDDVREIMIEGESGLLATAKPGWRPAWNQHRRRLEWPNGAQARYYTADEPERLRGKQHQAGWLEEPASWRYPESWDQFLFGLRLPPRPRAIVTGTPKPVRIVRELLADSGCIVTKGTTYENLANLAPAFQRAVIGRFEGTSLGRQELLAELLEDDEEAVVPLTWVRACQATRSPADVELLPVELGVDVGAGGDESVIRERRGPLAGRVWRDRQRDTMRVVGKTVRAARETGARRIKVDVIGIGHGVHDRLAEMARGGELAGVEVVGVDVGKASRHPDRYERLRDELWWEVGRRLSEDCGWDLSGLDQATIDQLTAPHYTTTSGGRVKVEAKDETRRRLNRSPDDADALLLAFYSPPPARRARIRA
jgi:phage terminase large subunit-like protein